MQEYFTRPRLSGIVLLIVSLLIWQIAKISPDLIEFYFSRELYPFIASVLAFFGSLLPVGLTGLVFAFIIGLLIVAPVRAWHRNKQESSLVAIVHAIIVFAAIAGWVFFFFSFTFLLNHHRYSEEKLYDLADPLTQEHLDELWVFSVQRANQLSLQLPVNEKGCSEYPFDLQALDALIEKEQTAFLRSQNLPAVETARIKHFLLGDVWLGMGVSGQYQPLLGQPNIPPGLPVYSIPYVVGHERGHLNGFASEAGATLLAYQTMFHSNDVWLQYLSLIKMWDARNPPEGINDRVASDLACWIEDWERVPRYKYRDINTKINNFYLEMSGHKDGVKSYGRGKVLGLKYYYKYIVQAENRVL